MQGINTWVNLSRDPRPLAPALWGLIPDPWPLIAGPWPLIAGPWPMLAVLILTCGCQPSAAPRNDGGASQSAQRGDPHTTNPEQTFVDVTQASGLDFDHVAEGNDPYFVPRSIGSGGALFDFDDDGLLDIYLIQNAGPESGIKNQLFRQNDDGTFEDVSTGSGLDVDGYGMGAAAGDVNNDGRVDLLLTEYGRARIFLNQSAGASPRFLDITESAGLQNRAWGTSAALFDFDRDGWLDIVIVNYLYYDPSRWCSNAGGRKDFCGPQSFSGAVARLFRNQGLVATGASAGHDHGRIRFEDVTVSSGLASQQGKGLGVLCADFDGDRWPDVFVANDGEPNFLWINQRDGTFREEAAARGLAYNSMGEAEADMGIAIGDVNDDGAFDVFVTHRTIETHTLWMQEPRGSFVDRTTTAGILSAERSTGFGTALADFDNDCDLDMALVNGRVLRATGPPPPAVPGLSDFWMPYAQPDQLLMNEGDGHFRDVSAANVDFAGLASVSRSLICGDINNDGRMDLLVTSIAGPASLFRNSSPAAGHWLMVRALDPELGRDAYGAEIRVQAGERSWLQWINPGYSYLASNDPRAHFGLGKFDQVDSIRVIWPDGREEVFPGTEVDRVIILSRGEGRDVESDSGM